MVSVNFQEIETLQHAGQWQQAGVTLATAAQQIEAAGADFLLICTNTMHRVAPQIERAIKIPLLHLADATAEQIAARRLSKVGLLGTRFTMEQDFYRGRLIEQHGLEVVTPVAADREIVHQIIYDELCQGVVNHTSRDEYLRIIEHLREQGAEGVIEGCTEIVMLVQQQHTDVPLFDTTAIHAQAAVARALT